MKTIYSRILSLFSIPISLFPYFPLPFSISIFTFPVSISASFLGPDHDLLLNLCIWFRLFLCAPTLITRFFQTRLQNFTSIQQLTPSIRSMFLCCLTSLALRTKVFSFFLHHSIRHPRKSCCTSIIYLLFSGIESKTSSVKDRYLTASRSRAWYPHPDLVKLLSWYGNRNIQSLGTITYNHRYF